MRTKEQSHSTPPQAQLLTVYAGGFSTISSLSLRASATACSDLRRASVQSCDRDWRQHCAKLLDESFRFCDVACSLELAAREPHYTIELLPYSVAPVPVAAAAFTSPLLLMPR